jgi:DNA-binding NtrC family response regulator
MHPELQSDALGTAHILIVEDEPLLRSLIAEVLREEGITVIEAANTDEAMRHLQVSSSVNLVFTDHHTPGALTGAQLAALIEEEWPGLPVVLTSGEFNGDGFRGRLIRKPYSAYEVARELTTLARTNRRGVGS